MKPRLDGRRREILGKWRVPKKWTWKIIGVGAAWIPVNSEMVNSQWWGGFHHCNIHTSGLKSLFKTENPTTVSLYCSGNIMHKRLSLTKALCYQNAKTEHKSRKRVDFPWNVWGLYKNLIWNWHQTAPNNRSHVQTCQKCIQFVFVLAPSQENFNSQQNHVSGTMGCW